MKLFSVNFINKTIQILLVFLFLINGAASFYMPILGIFVTEHIIGATIATVGIAIAIYSIIKSVVQVPLAKWLDSQAGERTDFFAILFGAITGILYSFGFLFVHKVSDLYILQIIAGLGDACTMAAYYAIFSHHIDKNSEGFEWSLLSVGGLTVSTAVGGLIGGLIAEKYGFSTIFILSGILNIIAAALILSLYPYIKILRRSHHYKTIIHEKR